MPARDSETWMFQAVVINESSMYSSMVTAHGPAKSLPCFFDFLSRSVQDFAHEIKPTGERLNQKPHRQEPAARGFLVQE
jgi:hypothetical protein